MSEPDLTGEAIEFKSGKNTISGSISAIQAQPTWAQFLPATFVADLFQYRTYRSNHLQGWLWRFLSVHHSSESLDWLAGSRPHLGEVFMTYALVMVSIYLCGFSAGAFNAYIILVGVQTVAIRANVNWDFEFLRYMIATP